MNGEELEAIAEEAIGDLCARRALSHYRGGKDGKRCVQHKGRQWWRLINRVAVKFRTQATDFTDESVPLNFVTRRSTVRSG